jgi:hypothetical protein
LTIYEREIIMERELAIHFPITKEFDTICEELLDTIEDKYNSSSTDVNYTIILVALDNSVNGEEVIKQLRIS